MLLMQTSVEPKLLDGVTTGASSLLHVVTGGNVSATSMSTPGTVRQVAEAAGFQGQHLDEATAVSLAESGAVANIINDTPREYSIGLWQINVKDNQAMRDRYGMGTSSDLTKPMVNATVAYNMSHGGTDWSRWSTWANGDYLKYMGENHRIIYKDYPPPFINAMAGTPAAPALYTGPDLLYVDPRQQTVVTPATKV
jgi:hypothetical protein